MATNRIHDRSSVLTVTNATKTAAVVAGEVFVEGILACVALAPIADAAAGPCAIEGVWRLLKDTGASTGGAQGAKAYLIVATGEVTAVSTANTYIGVFAAANGDNDVLADVAINVGFA